MDYVNPYFSLSLLSFSANKVQIVTTKESKKMMHKY